MRFFCVIVLLFSLGACSARPVQVRCEPLTDFTCTAECTQEDAAFTFTLTVSADGTFRLYTEQPSNLSGVGFIFEENRITTDANGITDTFRISAFTEQSPVRLLFESLQAFLFTGTEVLTAVGDGTYTAQRSIGTATAIACITQDGQLQSLQIPETNTTFTFHSYNQTE